MKMSLLTAVGDLNKTAMSDTRKSEETVTFQCGCPEVSIFLAVVPLITDFWLNFGVCGIGS
jgi:hypothetical protein